MGRQTVICILFHLLFWLRTAAVERFPYAQRIARLGVVRCLFSPSIILSLNIGTQVAQAGWGCPCIYLAKSCAMFSRLVTRAAGEFVRASGFCLWPNVYLPIQERDWERQTWELSLNSFTLSDGRHSYLYCGKKWREIEPGCLQFSGVSYCHVTVYLRLVVTFLKKNLWKFLGLSQWRVGILFF